MWIWSGNKERKPAERGKWEAEGFTGE